MRPGGQHHNAASLKQNGAKEQEYVWLLSPHAIIITVSFFFLCEKKETGHVSLLVYVLQVFFPLYSS